jgi:hypothetical protein
MSLWPMIIPLKVKWQQGDEMATMESGQPNPVVKSGSLVCEATPEPQSPPRHIEQYRASVIILPRYRSHNEL